MPLLQEWIDTNSRGRNINFARITWGGPQCLLGMWKRECCTIRSNKALICYNAQSPPVLIRVSGLVEPRAYYWLQHNQRMRARTHTHIKRAHTNTAGNYITVSSSACDLSHFLKSVASKSFFWINTLSAFVSSKFALRDIEKIPRTHHQYFLYETCFCYRAYLK